MSFSAQGQGMPPKLIHSRRAQLSALLARSVSRIVSGSTPNFSPRARPSWFPIKQAQRMRLLTIFPTWPMPTGPRWACLVLGRDRNSAASLDCRDARTAGDRPDPLYWPSVVGRRVRRTSSSFVQSRARRAWSRTPRGLDFHRTMEGVQTAPHRTGVSAFARVGGINRGIPSERVDIH
jgi:hypothetical protein